MFARSGDLHKIFSDRATMAKVNEGCRSAGIGCIECKGWAADALVNILNPMQERRKKYEDNPRLAWDILEAGSARASKVANATMNEVRDAMGMSLEYEAPQTEVDAGNESAMSEEAKLFRRHRSVGSWSHARGELCATRARKVQEESDFPFAVSVGDVYEGPLDLLLDLIRKQDIDIYDIPIGENHGAVSGLRGETARAGCERRG